MPIPDADARAWIELDLDALRANYATLRRAAGPGAAMIPMVKADGYGLGVGAVIRALEPLGPWGYGVATVAEGLELRRLGVTRPVLVVTPVAAREADAAAAAGLILAISSIEGLEAWAAAAVRSGAGDGAAEFHVEVDTGMGRTGFDWRDVGAWAPAVASRVAGAGGRLRWSGVFTHFHSADSPDPAPSVAQWERFRGTLVQLPVRADDLLVHAANSAALLRWPGYAAGAVRPGIFLYGGRPAPDVPGLPEPRDVVAVRSRLTLVRDRPPGSTAGYGATYVAAGPERWGTAAIGYGDGLPRALAAGGSALVGGVRVPIIGRISMDLTTVDLTAVPGARVGDVATWIGTDGADRIGVDEVAGRVGTIGYEILTGLGRRLARMERAVETGAKE
jgi:alanine racemase